MAMTDLMSGVRIGPWVVFRDQEGMRHAVKQGAILSISECEGEVTSIVMTGSRTALIRQTFDRVLTWFR
jgi:hypothetical protein